MNVASWPLGCPAEKPEGPRAALSAAGLLAFRRRTHPRALDTSKFSISGISSARADIHRSRSEIRYRMNSFLPWYRGPRRCDRQFIMTAGLVLIQAAASVVVTNAEGGRPAISVSRSARETRSQTDLVGMSVSLKGLGRHFTYTHLSWTRGAANRTCFWRSRGPS